MWGRKQNKPHHTNHTSSHIQYSALGVGWGGLWLQPLLKKRWKLLTFHISTVRNAGQNNHTVFLKLSLSYQTKKMQISIFLLLFWILGPCFYNLIGNQIHEIIIHLFSHSLFLVPSARFSSRREKTSATHPRSQSIKVLSYCATIVRDLLVIQTGLTVISRENTHFLVVVLLDLWVFLTMEPVGHVF